MKALLLGAGASRELGLQGVRELTDELKNLLTPENLDKLNDRKHHVLEAYNVLDNCLGDCNKLKEFYCGDSMVFMVDDVNKVNIIKNKTVSCNKCKCRINEEDAYIDEIYEKGEMIGVRYRTCKVTPAHYKKGTVELIHYCQKCKPVKKKTKKASNIKSK